MGFLDKLKGTAKQAANPGGQLSDRNKIMKINESGVEGRATVNAMRQLGSQLGGGKEMEFDLTVQREGSEPYQVTTRQSVHGATLEGVSEGSAIVVKIDPDDPQSLLVWGPAS